MASSSAEAVPAEKPETESEQALRRLSRKPEPETAESEEEGDVEELADLVPHACGSGCRLEPQEFAV